MIPLFAFICVFDVRTPLTWQIEPKKVERRERERLLLLQVPFGRLHLVNKKIELYKWRRNMNLIIVQEEKYRKRVLFCFIWGKTIASAAAAAAAAERWAFESAAAIAPLIDVAVDIATPLLLVAASLPPPCFVAAAAAAAAAAAVAMVVERLPQVLAMKRRRH